MSDSTTQLSKYQQYLPTEPLTTVSKAISFMESVKQVANLVSPVVALDYMPPMHRISPRVVQLDIEMKVNDKGNGAGGDIYRNTAFCNANEAALGKVALLKLLNAGNIDILELERTDDGKDRNVCSYSVLAAVPQMDGGKVLRRARKSLDFRPGSPDTKGFSANQLSEAQKHIESLCEAKCLTKLARVALGLKQKYTMDELRKPFVVPVLVFEPDMSDPIIKQMVAQHALGAQSALYGDPARRPVLLTAGEIIDVGDDDPQPTAEQAGSSPPKEAAPQPVAMATPPSTSPAAAVVSPIAWLPLTQQEIEQAPNDILPGGGTRRAWLGKLSAYASTVIEQHGRQLGGAAIARAIGGIDLATANGGDLSTIGQILRTEMQAGGAA